MKRSIILSMLAVIVLASIVASPTGAFAAKSQEFENGKAAGIVKASEDIKAMNADTTNTKGVDGNNPPPCPVPESKDYCKGWDKGYSDEVGRELG